MTANVTKGIHFLVLCRGRRRITCFTSSPLSPIRLPFSPHYRHHHHLLPQTPPLQNPSQSSSPFNICVPAKFTILTPLSRSAFRYVNTIISSEDEGDDGNQENLLQDEMNEEIEPIDSWEEEYDEAEPQIGDGGDGGGVVLQNCLWGERALSLAREVLLQFGEGIELFAFKTSPRGYIYIRLDKLSNEYGCPSMEEIISYNREYKKKIDEFGALGEIPNDLAIEVSSPGAERLLKVPDDLDRFKEYPMRVSYVEEVGPEKNGVFFLDSVETGSGICVWRLADVKENRDPAAKGRPLSRKLKDWRLKLRYANVKQVTLFLDY